MTVSEASRLLSGLPPASIIRSFSPNRGFILATQAIAGSPANRKPQSCVEEVIHAVAEELHIPPSEIRLHGVKKNTKATEARFVAVYALVLSGWTLRGLAGRLGYRGHCGPLNAVQRCHELRSVDPLFDAAVRRILLRLKIRDTVGHCQLCQR